MSKYGVKKGKWLSKMSEEVSRKLVGTYKSSFDRLYKVRQKSNETDLLFTIVFIFFKIVPLGSYTLMETFPLLVAALEVFNRYGVEDVRYTLLGVF